MVLAILAPVCAAQKHPQQQHARNGYLRKEARSSPSLFSPIFPVPTLKAKAIFWHADEKCTRSAKVGLVAAEGQAVPMRSHRAAWNAMARSTMSGWGADCVRTPSRQEVGHR